MSQDSSRVIFERRSFLKSAMATLAAAKIHEDAEIPPSLVKGVYTFGQPAVEKSGDTKCWTFTIFEEEWNYGFHQEMAHFVDCVQHDKQPLVTDRASP